MRSVLRWLLLLLAAGAVGPAAADARTLSAVRAVDVDSGLIADLAHHTLGHSLPGGAYLVVRTTVRAGGRGTDKVGRLKVVPAATARASAERPVVSIGNVTLGGRNVGSLVLRELFGPMTGRGLAFVDLSAKVAAASKREQQLYDDGRSDTPVKYAPLKPDYQVTGEGTVGRNGRISMTLTLRDAATGYAVATTNVSGKARNLKQLEGLFDKLGEQFAEEASEGVDRTPVDDRIDVTLDVVLLHAGSGSGSVTATPPGVTVSPGNEDAYQFKAAVGTTLSVVAHPDAGSYFVGWQSGSHCGTEQFQTRPPQYDCKVVDNGGGHFTFQPGADFDSCPPPGTYANNENESVCPGVNVIPPSG